MIRPPSAAVVDANDNIRSLVATKGPDRQVTEDRVQDAKELARLLQDALRDIAALDRRPCPRRIDFEDLVVDGTGTTQYRLPHGFGGRVRWWVVDAENYAVVNRDVAASTDDVLVIVSHHASTITVRIEEVGG